MKFKGENALIFLKKSEKNYWQTPNLWYNKSIKGKGIDQMTIEELSTKLTEWIDHYGITEESMNDFANTYATSYEEYNAIWEEILNPLLENN